MATHITRALMRQSPAWRLAPPSTPSRPARTLAESLPPGGGFNFRHQYSPPVPELATGAATPTASDAPTKTRGWCKQLIGATKQEALVDGTIKGCEPWRWNRIVLRNPSAAGPVRPAAAFWGLPMMMVGPLRITCWQCDGCMWVCEAHPERPWDGPVACGCGAAGARCPICNTVESPEMPPGFSDNTGSRHRAKSWTLRWQWPRPSSRT